MGQKGIEWKKSLLYLNTVNTGGPCNLIAYSQPLDLFASSILSNSEF